MATPCRSPPRVKQGRDVCHHSASRCLHSCPAAWPSLGGAEGRLPNFCDGRRPPAPNSTSAGCCYARDRGASLSQAPDSTQGRTRGEHYGRRLRCSHCHPLHGEEAHTIAVAIGSATPMCSSSGLGPHPMNMTTIGG